MQCLVGVLSFCGILGVVLNNYRDRRCFWLWLVSNAGFMVVDICHSGLYPRAIQHGIFFLLALHGAWQWREARNGNFG